MNLDTNGKYQKIRCIRILSKGSIWKIFVSKFLFKTDLKKLFVSRHLLLTLESKNHLYFDTLWNYLKSSCIEIKVIVSKYLMTNSENLVFWYSQNLFQTYLYLNTFSGKYPESILYLHTFHIKIWKLFESRYLYICI